MLTIIYIHLYVRAVRGNKRKKNKNNITFNKLHCNEVFEHDQSFAQIEIINIS